MRKENLILNACVLLFALSILCAFARFPVLSQSWPTTWIQIDWDKNENGPGDDWRDVEYAYYWYDSSYLYLKFKCYDLPGKEWSGKKEGRYKWFIDLDGNLYHSGGNIFDAEYLLFVEDTDQDGVGEIYLLYEANGDNDFSEYEPWPPTNYADYEVLDTAVAGWRIVSPYQIEMYVSWASIGNPSSYGVDWATDQQNPNLDQGPTTDHRDEEEPILVHDVAASSQAPSSTTVTQGDHVTIQVMVENQGTQTESFDVTCYFDTSVVGTLPVTNLEAGQSRTLYFDWDTTGVPPATYIVRAWADSSAAITEIDETDNWCTSPATVTIELPLVHDVAATSQTPDQTNVQQGTTVNIDVTVENPGDYTETFDVTCYYDNNPIGTKTVKSLLAKDSTTLTFNWDTAGVAPGTYYIKTMADSDRTITEVDEDNNNCTSTTAVTVYMPGQPGALFVDKALTAVVSGPDPPVVGFTTVYELTITVTNTGGSDVNGVVVEDSLSSDVTFVSVGTASQGTAIYSAPKITWNVGTLTPGASATLNFRVSLTPTTSGPKYLNRKEDLKASGTTLSNPVSDTGHTDVLVTAIVRDVAAVSQVPSSTIVIQGQTVAIDVMVENLGDTYAESFDVTCYYGGTAIGTLRAYNLSPGSSKLLKFYWDTTGVPPGTYVVNAKADSSDEIDESDENNNWCPTAASVKIVIHDIATISQTPSPTTVTEGETVTIQVVVENQGTEPETFTVACYYDTSQVGTAQTVTSLLPSTSTTLTFIWDTTGVSPGTYFISAVASTVHGETDTNDNSCTSTTTVTITALPLPPVGGVWVPINKFELIAPWIYLASLLLMTAISTAYIRYRKKR